MPPIHAGNTKIGMCAVDKAGTVLSCCRPRNTASDQALRMSSEERPCFHACLERNYRVSINMFVVRLFIEYLANLNCFGWLDNCLFSR